MNIYNNIITGHKTFADTYKIKLIDDVTYGVYGKVVSRSKGDSRIEGFNLSAEEADEGTESTVEKGVDVVMHHSLQECFAVGDNKKMFTLYLKEYIKKLLKKLQITAPDQIDVFKTNMNKVMKNILGRFKDLQFFTGESMDFNGMIDMFEYREIDGQNQPILMFFKHDLEEEKC